MKARKNADANTQSISPVRPLQAIETAMGEQKGDSDAEEAEIGENSLSQEMVAGIGSDGDVDDGSDGVRVANEGEEGELVKAEAAGGEREEFEFTAGTEDGGEEGRPARGATAPIRVSAKEREQHEWTHCPYRPWCRYCVLGRGKNMQHRAKRGRIDEYSKSIN